MPAYYLNTETPAALLPGDILYCPYIGYGLEFDFPPGQYKLEVWGAQGGYRSSTTYGGKGGYAKGILTLKSITKAYLYVGGSGNTGGTAGGFNGGGARTSYPGGGGATDIRLLQDSVYSRVIVAGGGGSDGAADKYGLYGGGATGGSATENYGTGGGGGTQTAGGAGGSNNAGSFGQGGQGLNGSGGYAGAGGGGWYGGGGSYPDSSSDDDRGGGGGSGYVYSSSTAGSYPSGCLLTNAYYLTDTSLVAGNASFASPTGTAETGHSGDGYIKITVISVEGSTFFLFEEGQYKPYRLYEKIANNWKLLEGQDFINKIFYQLKE